MPLNSVFSKFSIGVKAVHTCIILCWKDNFGTFAAVLDIYIYTIFAELERNRPFL